MVLLYKFCGEKCDHFTVVGSKYYENEKRKDMQIEERIARQKEELDGLTDQQRAVALAKVTFSFNCDKHKIVDMHWGSNRGMHNNVVA